MPRRLRIGWPRHYFALLDQGNYSVAGQDVALTYTPAADTTPNAFTFTDQTGAALSTVVTSAAITISGLSVGTSITLNASGGTIDKNANANFLGSQIVQNGDTVRARVTTSALNSTATNCTVVASPSGVQDVFTATTTAGAGSNFIPQPGFSATGTFADGGVVTINGPGGFGTKPNDPRPLLWMPLTSSATPSSLGRVTSARAVSQFTYSSTGGADGNGCYVGDTSSGGSADNNWTLRLDSDDWAGSAYDWNSYDQKIFISRRVKKNFGDLSVAGNYNVKDTRWWGRTSGGDIQAPSTYISRSNGRFGQEHLDDSPYLDYDRRTFNSAPFAAGNSVANRWYPEEIFTKTNSAANNVGLTPDTIYKWNSDGGGNIIDSPYTTYATFYLRWKNAAHDANDGRLRVMFPIHFVVDTGSGIRPSAPAGSVYQFDDLYVDDSWCRVVIGDSATYTPCSDRRPQPPSAWADGSVTFTTQSGGITLSGKHVHIVNNNDVAVYAGQIT